MFESFLSADDAYREKRFQGCMLGLLRDVDLNVRLDETSLQCEACGPDLELYEMMRQ